MPRAKKDAADLLNDDAKSSAQLTAEIKALQDQIAAKRKAEKKAKQREDAAAKQARELAEREFNRRFVGMAKRLPAGEGCKTVYQVIKEILDSNPDEPEGFVEDPTEQIGERPGTM